MQSHLLLSYVLNVGSTKHFQDSESGNDSLFGDAKDMYSGSVGGLKGKGAVKVSTERENLTVEVCRQRAEAFRAKAAAEPREEKKGLYLAVAESWSAIAAGLATLNCL